MAYAPPEDDPEEAARMEKAVVTALGDRVTELLALGLRGVEHSFLSRVDIELNVFRRNVADADMRQIKALAWKYRQRLPKHRRLKLPPDDPVVREMERRAG